MNARRTVDSFAALLATPLRGGVNAVCWPRAHVGDFDGLARALVGASDEGVIDVDVDALADLDLDDAARAAAAVVAADLAALRDAGKDPVLNVIRQYPRDARGLAIVVDVCSFHVDRADVEVDTFLCTYAGACSEGLDNACARRRLDDATVRSALRRDSGAADDDEFAAWVIDGSFDLHFDVVDGAGVFSFGVCALWKIACAWPGAPVPPCIHRAPATTTTDPPRLLLLC